MPRKKGNKTQNKGPNKPKMPAQNKSGVKGGGFGDVMEPPPRAKKKRK